MKTKHEDTTDQPIYTVSRLNNTVKSLLEETFTRVWVEGEISNFAAPNSGHWYFSLKDANAQVRCAMFKGNQRGLGFIPKDGMQVLIKANVSLYPARGDYQLIADFMEERGEGKLRRAYDLLKKKLETAGLFDEAHKQPLPVYPTRIGIITSATGAAVRDILHVLKRRYPCAAIIIYPTLVQGDTAAPTIVKAIELANQRNECDVIILARGGGSLEDLWPFNEEIVAHAIYQSQLPIITGIGHEVDFTIADFVADVRAPTPSAAAEIVTPDSSELISLLARYQQQIVRLIQQKIIAQQNLLAWTDKHLQQQHPKRKLTEKMQRLDFFELTLIKLQQQQLATLHARTAALAARLQQHLPNTKLQQIRHQLHLANEQLQHQMTAKINIKQSQLANSAATLDALSPLATLKRGYAIATHQHQILRDANQVRTGDKIDVKLMNGQLECVVN